MSDLVPRTDVTVEVVPLLTDRDEAERLVDGGFRALRSGAEHWQAGRADWERGQAMLAEAEQREAWRVLGYESWEACALAGMETHLRQVLDPDARMKLAVEMRRTKKATMREIAEVMDVSHPTVMRDLRRARDRGDLHPDDEPRPPRQGGAPDGPKERRKLREDLAKSWQRAVDDLTRRGNSLRSMRGDDRYKERLEHLLRTRGDLIRVRDAINLVLEDMEAARPLAQEETPPG